MTPTSKQIQSWATKHMTKRVKESPTKVIECIEGEDMEFHLTRQSETSFELTSVEPMSDFMKGAPLNLA
jgi:hypothetical protein